MSSVSNVINMSIEYVMRIEFHSISISPIVSQCHMARAVVHDNDFIAGFLL